MNPAHQVLRLTCPPGFDLRADHDRRAFVAEWLETVVDPWLERLSPDLRHYFGFDFARSGDLSVFLPLQEQQDLRLIARFILELRNVPFREQEQILFHVVDRLPRFGAGKMDASGNGQFLAEVARQRYGQRVEAVHLSQAWYLTHMPPMKAAFEDRTMELPRDADTLDDMRAIKLVRGVPMVPRDDRRAGADGRQRHGDTAVAAVLAHAASRADPVEYDYRTPAPSEVPDWRRRPEGEDFRPGGRFRRGAW